MNNYTEITKIFNLRPFIFFLPLLFVLVLHGKSFGQTVKIDYKADNKPLSQVLEDVTKQYKIKFAFDSEAFQKYRVSFSVKNLYTYQFINFLTQKYGLQFKLVESTYVVTRKAGTLVAPEAPVPTVPPVAVKPVPSLPVEKSIVSFSGYVTDRKTGDPLLYCSIVFPGQKGTITNDLGFFYVETNRDSLHLSISHLGYHRLDTVIYTRQSKPVPIGLNPISLTIETVSVVKKEKSVLEWGDRSGRIGFNPSQSANLARLSYDDLVNMLTMIPGVQFLDGHAGGLSIRGSDPSENLILLDGIPILETGHLFGNLSTLNAGFIRQSFVSRGGFDVQFGDRTSGIVELTGKSAVRSNPMVDISANMLNGNVLAVIPVSGKFSLSGAWRRSYIDQWKNYLFHKITREIRFTDLDIANTSATPTIRYQDFNLKATYQPSENQEFSIGFFRGEDQQMLDYQINASDSIYRNEWAYSINTGAGLNWNFQKGNWHHMFKAGFSEVYFRQEQESGEQTAAVITQNPGKGNSRNSRKIKVEIPGRTSFEFNRDSNLIRELRASWKSELKTGIFTHQAGAGIVKDNFSYKFQSATSTRNIPIDGMGKNSEQIISHFYLQQVLEPASWARIRWGVRTNYSHTIKKFYIQPRAGFEFTPFTDFKIYYHGGLYQQFLSKIPKIDINRNVDMVWFLPDSADRVILESVHHIAGIQWEKSGFLINAEMYYKHTTGKKWWNAELYKKANQYRIQYVNRDGQQENKGLDVFLQYRHPHFSHQLAWSFALSEEQINGINQGEYFPSLNDRRHQIQWTEIFTLKGWVASAMWNFRTGQPSLLDSDQSTVLEFKRLPYFSQIDLGIARNFKWNHFAVSAGLTLMNLLDRQNIVQVNYLNFSTSGGSSSIQSDISSLSRTPVFFIRMQVM